jgi:hypothetical protein
VGEPSWTDDNRHDPGVTIVALLAWLAIGLLLVRRLLDERRSGGSTACRR